LIGHDLSGLVRSHGGRGKVKEKRRRKRREEERKRGRKCINNTVFQFFKIYGSLNLNEIYMSITKT
jgi:hypothetical protein